MKKALKWALIGLIAGSLTASCTAGEGGKAHTALAPTESPSPKPSPTGRITTASGATLYIDRAQVTGGGAALCPANNPQCTVPQGGGSATTIFLRSEGPSPIESDLYGVYLSDSVGHAFEVATGGADAFMFTHPMPVPWSDTPRFVVVFDAGPPPRGHVLHWPGNEPIGLDPFIPCNPHAVGGCP